MAEGFARAYGSDVVEPFSAGLYPTGIVAPLTKKIMLEKNIDLSGQFPKALDGIPAPPPDIVINMSGQTLPATAGAVIEEWTICDPIGESEERFREVANEIEQRVMRLILTLRARSQAPPSPPGLTPPRRSRIM